MRQRIRTTPPVKITTTLRLRFTTRVKHGQSPNGHPFEEPETDLLYSRHPKQNMPQLLNQPPNTIVVCHIRRGDPIQNPHVVIPRPFPNALSSDGKLGTALMPNILGHIHRMHPEKFPEEFGHLVDHVFIVKIYSHGVGLVQCTRAAGYIHASQVRVALEGDGFEAEVLEVVLGFCAGDVVVPMLGAAVQEDCVRG